MNAIIEKPKLPVVEDDSDFSVLLDSERFGQMQRVANMFSQSELVPEVFQGKPANCAVALQMAFRLKVDPMMFMQSTYIVHGRPGIEAKLAIALINARGPFTGPIQWKFDGEGKTRKCAAYATHRKTQEKCEATVTWAMVEAEGWSKKSGSKWLTMPDLMFQYRSATFLGRLYCPEVLLGLPTSDELHDTGEIVIAGERIEEPRKPQAQIEMPRAKKEAVIVDTETGEITNIVGNTKGSDGEGNSPVTAEASQPVEPPRAKPHAAAQKTVQDEKGIDTSPARDTMKNVVRRKMEAGALSDVDLKAKFGFTVDDLRMCDVNPVLEWVQNPAGQ